MHETPLGRGKSGLVGGLGSIQHAFKIVCQEVLGVELSPKSTICRDLVFSTMVKEGHFSPHIKRMRGLKPNQLNYPNWAYYQDNGALYNEHVLLYWSTLANVLFGKIKGVDDVHWWFDPGIPKIGNR
jgi:hypothetical protein